MLSKYYALRDSLKHNQRLVWHPLNQEWIKTDELALGNRLTVIYHVEDLKRHLLDLFEQLDRYSPFFGQDWLLMADKVYGEAVGGGKKFRSYFRQKLY